MFTKSKLIFIVFLAFVVLAGCQFSPSNLVPQVTPESALYTQAAQTVVAQLTLNAIVDATNAADQAVATQGPAATATSTGPQPANTEPATPNPSPTPEASTPTPTATSSPTPTQTPVLPTPTISSEDVTKSLGGSTWNDNFDNGDNWSFSKDDRISMEVEDGKAVLIAKNPDYFYGWAVTWPKPKDFYLEMTVSVGADCSGKDKYGLIFRSPDPSEGNLLGFSCDGQFKAWYWDGDKENIFKDWTKNSKINAGPNQTNRIGIKAVGNVFTIYANGIEISSFTDNRETEGRFGLMVGSDNTTNFTVYVDKMTYWDLTK